MTLALVTVLSKYVSLISSLDPKVNEKLQGSTGPSITSQ